jgi:hypothetical protein
MREYGGDVDYEGIPINSLRNLPVSHFIPELHISEDETNRRPSAAPINEFVELVYARIPSRLSSQKLVPARQRKFRRYS